MLAAASIIIPTNGENRLQQSDSSSPVERRGGEVDSDGGVSFAELLDVDRNTSGNTNPSAMEPVESDEPSSDLDLPEPDPDALVSGPVIDLPDLPTESVGASNENVGPRNPGVEGALLSELRPLQTEVLLAISANNEFDPNIKQEIRNTPIKEGFTKSPASSRSGVEGISASEASPVETSGRQLSQSDVLSTRLSSSVLDQTPRPATIAQLFNAAPANPTATPIGINHPSGQIESARPITPSSSQIPTSIHNANGPLEPVASLPDDRPFIDSDAPARRSSSELQPTPTGNALEVPAAGQVQFGPATERIQNSQPQLPVAPNPSASSTPAVNDEPVASRLPAEKSVSSNVATDQPAATAELVNNQQPQSNAADEAGNSIPSLKASDPGRDTVFSTPPPRQVAPSLEQPIETIGQDQATVGAAEVAVENFQADVGNVSTQTAVQSPSGWSESDLDQTISDVETAPAPSQDSDLEEFDSGDQQASQDSSQQFTGTESHAEFEPSLQRTNTIGSEPSNRPHQTVDNLPEPSRQLAQDFVAVTPTTDLKSSRVSTANGGSVTAANSIADRLIQSLAPSAIESIVHDIAASTVRRISGLDAGQTHQMMLQIHPEELGSLEIRVESAADVFRAQIVASEFATTELLNREKAVLHSALQDLNLEVGDLEISHQGTTSDHQSSNRSDEQFSDRGPESSFNEGSREEPHAASEASRKKSKHGDSNLNLIA